MMIIIDISQLRLPCLSPSVSPLHHSNYLLYSLSLFLIGFQMIDDDDRWYYYDSTTTTTTTMFSIMSSPEDGALLLLINE